MNKEENKYKNFIKNGHKESELFNDELLQKGFIEYINAKYDTKLTFKELETKINNQKMSLDDSNENLFAEGYCGVVSGDEGYKSPIERINGSYYTEWEGISDEEMFTKLSELDEYAITNIIVPDISTVDQSVDYEHQVNNMTTKISVDDPYKRLDEINKLDSLNSSVDKAIDKFMDYNDNYKKLCKGDEPNE